VLHPEAALAYVVNEMSATVTTLAYHQDGRLTPLSEDALLPDDVPGIRSGGEILMHPSGAWLYVTHRSHGSSGPRPGGGEDCIVRFRIDASTGRPHDPVRIASGGSIPRTAAFRDGGAGLRVGHQGSGTIVDFDIDPVEGTLYPTGVVIDTPVPVCVIVA
jgi:6-phosphogluconolactonase (cycloisomerase 2 family)